MTSASGRTNEGMGAVGGAWGRGRVGWVRRGWCGGTGDRGGGHGDGAGENGTIRRGRAARGRGRGSGVRGAGCGVRVRTGDPSGAVRCGWERTTRAGATGAVLRAACRGEAAVEELWKAPVEVGGGRPWRALAEPVDAGADTGWMPRAATSVIGSAVGVSGRVGGKPGGAGASSDVFGAGTGRRAGRAERRGVVRVRPGYGELFPRTGRPSTHSRGRLELDGGRVDARAPGSWMLDA